MELDDKTALNQSAHAQRMHSRNHIRHNRDLIDIRSVALNAAVSTNGHIATRRTVLNITQVILKQAKIFEEYLMTGTTKK